MPRRALIRQVIWGAAAALAFAGAAGASVSGWTKASPLQAKVWFNVPQAGPFPGKDLSGKVTLIFFWTAQDPACAHAAQYVKRWFREYRDRGLQVLGVISPEFTADAGRAPLHEEIAGLRIYFPVAVDEDLSVKRDQGVVSWPAVIVIDRAGYIRDRYEGVLPFDDIERLLEYLLTQRGPETYEKS
jgi:peroxiredoxin